MEGPTTTVQATLSHASRKRGCLDGEPNDRMPKHNHKRQQRRPRSTKQNNRQSFHRPCHFTNQDNLPLSFCIVCLVKKEQETIKNELKRQKLLDGNKSCTTTTNPNIHTTPREPPKYKCPKCLAWYCSVACCQTHKLTCPGKPPLDDDITRFMSPFGTGVPTKGEGFNNDNDDNVSDSDDDDDESMEDGWRITDDMKQAVQNSSWLYEQLQDGGLRDMISTVVRSTRKRKENRKSPQFQSRERRPKPHLSVHAQNPGRDSLLETKRNHPNFSEFCDKMLVLTGVLERQQEASSSQHETISFGGIAMSSSTSTTGKLPRDEQELEQWLRQKWSPNQPPPQLALKSARKPIPNFEPVDISSSSSEDDDEDDDESEQEDDQ